MSDNGKIAQMISTQILDIARGEPGARIPVDLDYFITGQGWKQVGHGVTGRDGSIAEFGEVPAAGVYRLVMDVAAYMPHIFFPSLSVTFESKDAAEDHHLVVQISPFGYSVCRVL